jgi:hypothetical protein
MAAAFALTVTAGITGLSMRGETKESPVNQACAHATWPLIPDSCLTGADAGRAVRIVGIHAAAAPETMSERFALAFN